MKNQSRIDSFSVLSLVLGIVACLLELGVFAVNNINFWLFSIFGGMLLGVIGLVIGSIASITAIRINRKKSAPKLTYPKAVTGILLSTLGILASVGYIVVVLMNLRL